MVNPQPLICECSIAPFSVSLKKKKNWTQWATRCKGNKLEGCESIKTPTSSEWSSLATDTISLRVTLMFGCKCPVRVKFWCEVLLRFWWYVRGWRRPSSRGTVWAYSSKIERRYVRVRMLMRRFLWLELFCRWASFPGRNFLRLSSWCGERSERGGRWGGWRKPDQLLHPQ